MKLFFYILNPITGSPVFLHFQKDPVVQACQTRNPRARYDPPRTYMWPAKPVVFSLFLIQFLFHAENTLRTNRLALIVAAALRSWIFSFSEISTTMSELFITFTDLQYVNLKVKITNRKKNYIYFEFKKKSYHLATLPLR